MKRVIALLAGAALVLMSTIAMAVPITGEIDFTGSLSLVKASAVPLTTTQNATGIAFVPNSSFVGTTHTGIFASIPNFTQAVFHNFTFAPALANLTNPLWEVTVGATSYSFDMSSVSYIRVAPNFLLLNGLGTLNATGFDATPGTWAFSTQDGQLSGPVALTFSAVSDATPVPEPGTVMLLGAGLLGLAVYGKRRKNA